MTRGTDPGQILLDPAVLARLRAELDDDEGWFLFIQRFVAHLPFRVQKLRTGLLGGDHGVAMDAVLSLKISSQMVGAERLAGLAVCLQRRIEARCSAVRNKAVGLNRTSCAPLGRFTGVRLLAPPQHQTPRRSGAQQTLLPRRGSIGCGSVFRFEGRRQHFGARGVQARRLPKYQPVGTLTAKSRSIGD